MVGQLIHFEIELKPLSCIWPAANRLNLTLWACFCKDPGAMRCAGHVPHMGDRRDAYKGLMGKPEGERPLARSRRRCEDNIKMDLQ